MPMVLKVTLHQDENEAVAGADVVVTDTWVSMGQEHVHNKLAAMMPYQVNDVMMGAGKGRRAIPALSPRPSRRRSHAVGH